MVNNPPIIIWFRQDLRLTDNPAFHVACENNQPIIPLYILDDKNAVEWKMGAASRVWLHHSLDTLHHSLNGNLIFESGDATQIIPRLIEQTKASAIYWNRCYEPWRIARDKKVKLALEKENIETKSFNGSLLWEPWKVLKSDGTAYKVFSPFYRKGCLKNAQAPRSPLPRPNSKNICYAAHNYAGKKLEDLNLLPKTRWDKKMVKHWDIGEKGAKKCLQQFLDTGLKGYKDGRNFPAIENVSRLSPYLHFGEISPHIAWYAAQECGTLEGWEQDRDHFLSELGWREFSYSLLYHFPQLPRENLQKKFNDFPWNTTKNDNVKIWRKGLTGYPIVDAGMRELWETGYMHNRVRMIVGSFLVKNLLTHWHEGEKWFWDCLFDADLANNAASWQWIAGCGADAAPYFRIFNPILQSKKFDPDGEYIRHYVPEIKNLPNKYLHEPWEAPDNVLEYAKIKMGEDYPYPIIQHSAARDRALEAFQSIKKVNTA